MNTFRIDLQKYFDQLPDEEKELFSQYFNDTIKEYAKEFDNTQESEELSQVWNYMSGNIELKTVSNDFSMEELAIHLAGKVLSHIAKDQVSDPLSA